jgi:methylated-DNA-[protein]-cysteine S-methyltransferase
MPTDFEEKVYEITRKIPRGRVSTYKEIARAMKTEAYRAVGNALNKNPYAPLVPCHRVVNSSGRLGGFARGTKAKEELLKKEDILVEQGKIKDFKRIHFAFQNY